MKIFLTLLLVSSFLSSAQVDVYKNYRHIDTTQYRLSNALYLYNLTLKESNNQGKVILEWENQRNITYHMIEMRDPLTDELIYRQKHYTNMAEFPENGNFTLYPIYYKQMGDAISINLKEAVARNYEPISPPNYYRYLEKQAEIDQKNEKRAAMEMAEKKRIAVYENKIANRITPKAVVLILIVFIFAVVIVFAIWLIRYLTKPKELSRQAAKEHRDTWG